MLPNLDASLPHSISLPQVHIGSYSASVPLSRSLLFRKDNPIRITSLLSLADPKFFSLTIIGPLSSISRRLRAVHFAPNEAKTPHDFHLLL